MLLLNFIRKLRVLKPKDDETNAVVRLEIEAPRTWARPWEKGRASEYLTAGECVTVGMTLLAQGVTNQERGSMAVAYARSAITNLLEELDAALARDNAIAKLLEDAR